MDKDGNRIFAGKLTYSCALLSLTKIAETIATEAETSSRKRGISPAPAGSRVSKRLKTKTAKSINGVIKVIEMDKNDTVKDLRIKVSLF